MLGAFDKILRQNGIALVIDPTPAGHHQMARADRSLWDRS